jgi:hypothetical protein
MHRVQSQGGGAVVVPTLPKPAKVADEEVIEDYDDDFDVDCDSPCMKVSPTPHSIEDLNLWTLQLSPRGDGNSDSLITLELLGLPRAELPVFEAPDEDDIEMWLAESEDRGSAAG